MASQMTGAFSRRRPRLKEIAISHRPKKWRERDIYLPRKKCHIFACPKAFVIIILSPKAYFIGYHFNAIHLLFERERETALFLPMWSLSRSKNRRKNRKLPLPLLHCFVVARRAYLLCESCPYGKCFPQTKAIAINHFNYVCRLTLGEPMHWRDLMISDFWRAKVV